MPKRVLIIDNEPDILFGLKRQFQSPSVEVDTAETKEEAEALLGKQPYHVVITDLMLNGSNGNEGLEVIRDVNVQHPETKTILITAYGSQAAEEEAYEASVSYYFEKPITGRTLSDALRNLGIETE